MKMIDVDFIKRHSRICCNCEDTELESLGESAEEVIFQMLGRDYDDLVGTYGKVPWNVRHAALELAEHFYQHRGVDSSVSLSVVPYNFDLLVKPYIKL